MLTKQEQPVRVRFSPSPTGELHLGSARTALYNFLFAKQQGGQFIFRVEDTDQTRYVPGALDRFQEDLRWLGLTWDEGPEIGGPHAPYIQSQRTELYQRAAQELLETGHAYHCFCTPDELEKMRAEQVARHEPPRYNRHCRTLTSADVAAQKDAGKPFVIRLMVPDGETVVRDAIRGDIRVQNKEIDDQVLLKSDGFPTYHLAVVVDDHAMQISHVIRGEEWLPSTPKHLMLYAAFGWQPPQFAHLPLLLAPDKKKLSKRVHGELVWVATYRAAGYLPEALVNYLALLGWNPGDAQEFFSLKELTSVFALDRVHKAGAIFDQDKLQYMNGVYLRQKSLAELKSLLKEGSFLGGPLDDLSDDALTRWLTITHERLITLADFKPQVWEILKLADYQPAQLIFRKSDHGRAQQGLRAAYERLSEVPATEWHEQAALQTALSEVVAASGLTNGDVFWPTRVALSGLAASPSPVELLWVLGKDEALARLEAGLAKLAQSA